MANTRKRRKSIWTNWFGKLVTALAAVMLLMSAACLVRMICEDIRIDKTATSVRALYYGTVSAETAIEETPAPEEAQEAENEGTEGLSMPVLEPEVKAEPTLQPQFEELYAENADLIGWIKVNGEIEYPIVRRDNSFYMDHDFYGEYSQAGWIFLDERNQTDMSDDNLLVYGHNMKNGEMFGELDRYRELEYVKEHPIIEVQSAWEAEPRRYVLIALFDASMNRSDASYIKITEFNFEEPEEKQAFIESLRARSIFETPVEADAEDQLIMLVTCSYSHDNGRFLMVARKLRAGESEDGIAEAFSGLK